MYPDTRIDDALTRLLERRSVKAMDISAPGPSDADLDLMLRVAIRVPDHGKLAPWRFIRFAGEARASFGEVLASRFSTLNPQARQHSIDAERERFTRAPTVVAVIARITPDIKIPVWEQQLSVGAACQNLLVAANLAGYAAQWLTEWYAFDEEISKALSLKDNERVAGFVYIGSAQEKPAERARTEIENVVSDWHPTS